MDSRVRSTGTRTHPDKAVPDHSPDGGTRVLPKKLTITVNIDFQYATNRLWQSLTPQNAKPPATGQPSEEIMSTYVAGGYR
jgi:hypothetical protein